ncbi:MAG: hypothetical protein EOP33_04495 [Rickettsiaceae bacterium]|nr:MAG: hypothetical protein EOP33_04495 [Rickettsiaceae bacterium]
MYRFPIFITRLSFDICMLLVPGNKQDNKFGLPPLKPTKNDYFIAIVSSSIRIMFVLLFQHINESL